ncbi:MAG: T9SS type A sorting domain-containing protein [Fibromonadaceae bacterium]|nr:T9SS type A sorting domain-containing protein [Fibromonadaceae bacterium]
MATCQEPNSSGSGDGTPTHLSQTTTGNILAYATTNAITLQNLPANAKVDVYNVQGKRVYPNRANPSIGGIGVQTIDVHAKGVYIVKISRGVSNTPNANNTPSVFRVVVR